LNSRDTVAGLDTGFADHGLHPRLAGLVPQQPAPHVRDVFGVHVSPSCGGQASRRTLDRPDAYVSAVNAGDGGRRCGRGDGGEFCVRQAAAAEISVWSSPDSGNCLAVEAFRVARSGPSGSTVAESRPVASMTLARGSVGGSAVCYCRGG
jgi:hypothetical protein